jgi:hypothetical protein
VRDFFTFIVGVYLIISSSLSNADGVHEKKYAYKIKDVNADVEKITGSLGRVQFFSDSFPKNENKIYAYIALHDLNGEDPLVVNAVVYVYEKKCKGLPQYFFSFGEIEGEKAVLPQTFGVLDGACVEIELYGLDKTANNKEKSRVKLFDRFEVNISKK